MINWKKGVREYTQMFGTVLAWDPNDVPYSSIPVGNPRRFSMKQKISTDYFLQTCISQKYLRHYFYNAPKSMALFFL